ncbi:MAG: hypothetical protein J7K13_04060 [Thermoplasmata archaeon]|nr:hypothetical protein [Thermoplasmata archaeon]
MGEEVENIEKKTLNMFELNDEITSLVAKGKINVVIGEKIKEKIKEKGINLTKEQLYELVDRINKNLRFEQKPVEHKTETTPATTPSPATSVATTPQAITTKPESSEDMKNLLESLENLHKRVETLEKSQTEWMKNWSRYMKKMGSNEPMEKTTLSIQQETDFYPLSTIPNDPESIVIVMKWLQYLVDKVGKSRVADVLNYYVDVGWITEEAKMKLLEYCEGITGREGSEAPVTNLMAKDHIQSFLFIQKLMGSNVDEYFISRIERDIAKLTKNLDNLTLR